MHIATIQGVITIIMIILNKTMEEMPDTRENLSWEVILLMHTLKIIMTTMITNIVEETATQVEDLKISNLIDLILTEQKMTIYGVLDNKRTIYTKLININSYFNK